MKRFAPLLVIGPVLLVLLGFGLWGLLAPDHEMSWAENRTLAQFPVLDPHAWTGIPTAFNDYTADQFPARERLLRVYTRLQLALGKKQVRGAFVSRDGWLFIQSYDADMGALAAALTRAAETQPGPEYWYAALPTKPFCLPEADPLLIETAGRENLERMETALAGTAVRMTEAATALAETGPLAERQAQWYATDFHWNGRGAYAAISHILREMQAAGAIGTVSTEDLLSWETPDREYQGDLNRRFSNVFPIEAAGPVVHCRAELACYTSRDDSAPVAREAVFGSGLRETGRVDYNSLYAPNMAYLRVVNPQAPEQKRLVLLKDSLANAGLEIFFALFSQVEVVDARYTQAQPFSDLAQTADLVLVMLHQNNPAAETQAYLRGED